MVFCTVAHGLDDPVQMLLVTDKIHPNRRDQDTRRTEEFLRGLFKGIPNEKEERASQKVKVKVDSKDSEMDQAPHEHVQIPIWPSRSCY